MLWPVPYKTTWTASAGTRESVPAELAVTLYVSDHRFDGAAPLLLPTIMRFADLIQSIHLTSKSASWA